ncbi:putative transporter [Sphingobium sp. SYK-6]|uniref:cation:proton antiporter domain-containing protein n=1 Tax=Sphingobium sp. (strain NBRC 103272 / SYK-6) TaxID=627192 RepID=UPI00022776E9|nr:cation:proton antiporter [Sphingobium sp. SYK-6]BAK66214.1 putative transporter [Sphingobium sp. SYK-6]
MIHGPFGSQGYSDALVILGAAGLVIPAFARYRISPVIGFILVGMLVGPYGLGQLIGRYPALSHVTIGSSSAISSFAEFGIVLLLFSIGLELSFKRLWSMRALVFGLGAAELLGSALVIAAGFLLFDSSWYSAIGLGLALALSSTALVLPISGTRSPVGKAAFSMLLFEDLALVPIVFALGAMAPNVGDDGWTNLATVFVQGVVTVVAMFVAGRLLLPRLFAQAARTKSSEVFLAASLLVVMVSSLITVVVGLSPIVGALVAGLLIAETDYHGEVESITEPFKGLALGVFLITVGMGIDPLALMRSWDKVLLAVVAVLVTKTIVTGLLLRLAGARRGMAFETATLMASPSETTLIVLSTAVIAGLISADTAAFWQMVTAIGLTITPILARIGHDTARRIEARASDRASEEPGPESGGAIILGFGRVGRMVADLLRTHDQPYVAVESNIDIVGQARRDGYVVRFGDVARPDTLDRLRIGHARALIITMDDPVLAVRVTRRVRSWAPDLPIIVRARDTDHAAELYRAGASDAVPEALESSLHLAETALVDLGIAVGPVIASVHQKRDDLQKAIKAAAQLEQAPRLSRYRLSESGETGEPA